MESQRRSDVFLIMTIIRDVGEVGLWGQIVMIFSFTQANADPVVSVAADFLDIVLAGL